MQTYDGYRAIMQEQSRDVHNAAIATKIVQLMDRLRDNSYEGQARRWIWELIQNAKDAAADGVPVKIQVELWEDKVTFSHNGKPFRVKNILSIINQVSSKSGSDDTSTGKFGTGFITTHLLSEQVWLQGILQDVSLVNGGMLPAKSFSILLDRSGSNTEEIIAAVQKALTEIEQLDDQPDAQPGGDYTTHFTYPLDSERARAAARAGLEDLQHTAAYALAFVDGIQEIVIIDHQNDSTRQYVRARERCLQAPHLFRLRIEQCTNYQISMQFLLLYRDHGGILAAPIDEEFRFLPIHGNTPRIFVDFPLIGSEQFPFPVVFCHSALLPDETRSWLPLSHKQESRNSIHNKAILEQAMEDCCRMLERAEAGGMRWFSQICRTPSIPQRSDLDAAWMEQRIFAPFWETMKERRVVSTEQGMLPLGQKGLVFPVSADEAELQQLHQLLCSLPDTLVPDETELADWSAVFLPMEQPPLPCMTLANMAHNAQSLFAMSGKQLPWLQKLYDAVLQNEALRAELKQGDLALLPDQTASMQLHSLGAIYRDPWIDHHLKDAMEALNGLQLKAEMPPLAIRGLLVHGDFDPRDIGVAVYGVQELFNAIETRSDRNVRVVNYAYYYPEYHRAWYSGWRHMVACDQTDTWFTFAQEVFPEEMEEMTYAPSTYASQSNIWRPSRLGIRNRICDQIKTYGSLQCLQEMLFPDRTRKAVQQWLSHFATAAFAEGSVAQMVGVAYLPDQYGSFHTYTALQQDGGIDEELKDITGLLSKHHNVTDIRTILLDGNFHLPVEYVPILKVQDVAAVIGNAVETMLQNGGLAQTDEEMQMACAKLITWMNDHEEETRRLFPRYTTEEARAQLVAPKAVANLIQTQKQVDRVLHQLGAESLEELLEQMEVLKARNMPQTGPLGELESMADASEYANDEAFTQRCRQIGEAGEAAALQWLARQAMEQGAVITHQSEREIQLERNGIHIRFYRADGDSYHQAGYDIVRTEEQPDGTVLLQTYYEVKSTTRTDQMYRFQLSPMQMQTAIQMGDAYRILRLFLSKDSLELRNVVMVTNLLRQLMGQSVLPVDDPVTFRMMQCPYDL